MMKDKSIPYSCYKVGRLYRKFACLFLFGHNRLRIWILGLSDGWKLDWCPGYNLVSPFIYQLKNGEANLSRRLIAVRSLSTSKVTSISTMFSSDFGPQRAVTDARQEGAPKVWICVVFALRDMISVLLGKWRMVANTLVPVDW